MVSRYVSTSNLSIRENSYDVGSDVDTLTLLFNIVWLTFLAIILYNIIKSCLRGRTHHSGQTPGSSNRPDGPSGRGRGWFPGGNNDFGNNYQDPPPPYSKGPSSGPQTSWWNPGFWTGAALGGLGAHLFNSMQRPRAYDWERDRILRAPPPVPEEYYSTSGWTSGQRRRSAFDSTDRGEGSSNLGSMRSSTGLGASRVR